LLSGKEPTYEIKGDLGRPETVEGVFVEV